MGNLGLRVQGVGLKDSRLDLFSQKLKNPKHELNIQQKSSWQRVQDGSGLSHENGICPNRAHLFKLEATRE